jgi:hypothetical protein
VPDIGNENALAAGPFELAADQDIELTLNIGLPPGARLNSESPWSVRVIADGATLVERTGQSSSMPLTVVVPGSSRREPGEWRIEAVFASCAQVNGGVCTPHRVRWVAPVRSGDARTMDLRARLEGH